MKKSVLQLIIVLLILTLVPFTEFKAIDFEANEDYYSNLC